MSVTVYLSGHLKPFADGKVEISLDGDFATVGDALDSLWKQHIGLRERVVNEVGDVRQHVNIFAGNRDIKRLDGLATELRSNQIHIFNAVSGG